MHSLLRTVRSLRMCPWRVRTASLLTKSRWLAVFDSELCSVRYGRACVAGGMERVKLSRHKLASGQSPSSHSPSGFTTRSKTLFRVRLQYHQLRRLAMEMNMAWTLTKRKRVILCYDSVEKLARLACFQSFFFRFEWGESRIECVAFTLS